MTNKSAHRPLIDARQNDLCSPEFQEIDGVFYLIQYGHGGRLVFALAVETEETLTTVVFGEVSAFLQDQGTPPPHTHIHHTAPPTHTQTPPCDSDTGNLQWSWRSVLVVWGNGAGSTD
jgi:hypothetical protein